MTKTALVTGATSGIGAAFARYLASDGHELVLVARNEKRLETTAADIRETHGAAVSVLPADLTSDTDLAVVSERATTVDLLINNAGMALGKGFTYAAVADEEQLLKLNVHSVLRLTHAALPAMRERGHGGIINVSSVAGFGPIMPGSTYNASKAWVTNFSQSMAPMGRKDGVSVMALAPGFVRTEFHDRAAIDMSGTPNWMMLDADMVAEVAMRDLLRGKTLSVPSLTYKLATVGIRHLPTGLLTRIATQVDSLSGRGKTR